MWSSAPPPRGPRAPGASGLYQAGAHARSVRPRSTRGVLRPAGRGVLVSRHDGRCGGPLCGIARPTAIGRRRAARRADVRLSTPARRPPARTNSGDPLAGWDPDHIGVRHVRPRSIRYGRATRDDARRCLTRSGRAAASRAAGVARGRLYRIALRGQKLGLSPSAAAPAGAAGSGPTAITDDMIDAVAERRLARLSTQSRPAILDVAERLVREEIERLKQ